MALLGIFCFLSNFSQRQFSVVSVIEDFLSEQISYHLRESIANHGCAFALQSLLYCHKKDGILW